MTNLTGIKLGASVKYTDQIQIPKPPAQGIVMVPSIIPFFGGNYIGLMPTQFTGKAEVLSTGEGSLSGKGQTGFAAAGDAIRGFVEGQAKGILDSQGWSLKDGTLTLGISDKLEKEAPLLSVIPALAGPMAALEKLWPGAAAAIASRAKATLELEPKWGITFNFEAPKGGGIVFKDADFPEGLGIKVGVELNLIEKCVNRGREPGRRGNGHFPRAGALLQGGGPHLARLRKAHAVAPHRRGSEGGVPHHPAGGLHRRSPGGWLHQHRHERLAARRIGATWRSPTMRVLDGQCAGYAADDGGAGGERSAGGRATRGEREPAGRRSHRGPQHRRRPIPDPGLDP